MVSEDHRADRRIAKRENRQRAQQNPNAGASKHPVRCVPDAGRNDGRRALVGFVDAAQSLLPAQGFIRNRCSLHYHTACICKAVLADEISDGCQETVLLTGADCT